MKGQRTQDEHRVCVRKHYSEYTNFGRGNKISLKAWLFVEKQQSKLTRVGPCEESKVSHSSLLLFLQEQFPLHMSQDCGLLCFLVSKVAHPATHPASAIMRWGIVCISHCSRSYCLISNRIFPTANVWEGIEKVQLSFQRDQHLPH